METLRLVGVDEEKAANRNAVRIQFTSASGGTIYINRKMTSATSYKTIWDVYREKIESFSNPAKVQNPVGKIASSFAALILKALQSYEIFPIALTSSKDGHIFFRFKRGATHFVIDVYPEGNIIFLEKESNTVFKSKEISLLDIGMTLNQI